MRNRDSPAPTAVFRLDAGVSIGGGHAIRCLALADALSDDGWHCSFTVSEPGAAVVRQLIGSRHTVIGLREAESLDPAALQATAPKGCELLIVDHYGWSASQERACRGWADRVLVLDDLCNRPHECDLLLDVSLERQPLDYAQWLGRDSTVLLGPGFAPLRREFPIRRMNMSRSAHTPASRVFVNFGLADTRNFSEQVLEALGALHFRGGVDIVLGSRSPNLVRLRTRAERLGPGVRIHVEPPDIASLMSASDIAIGAGGGSTWERCCLALPTVMITAADNQARNARTVAARGACILLRDAASNLVPQLSEVLATLLHDGALRERMSLAAAAMTDGRGARRVALALRPEPTRQGARVTLRRLTRDDGERTYRWQQHPATRRYARNPSIPSSEDHVAWIAQKLSDPGCVLEVIELDGMPAGVVRLDRVPRPGGELACEVSIYVAPELAGRGVGTAALAALRRLAPEAWLLATVLNENRTSHALFSKAGYGFEHGMYVSKPVIDPREQN